MRFLTTHTFTCINGGQANLAASTTDFGRFSLVASGKSTSEIFTGSVKGTPSTNDTTFTVDGVTASSGWHGSSVRPASNMLVEVGGNLYPILSSTVVSATEFTVTISRPDSSDRTQNLGLSNSPADNSAVKFYLRSMIASSGHTMEYVGAGVDYRALPEYAAGTYAVGAGTSPNGVHKNLIKRKSWTTVKSGQLSLTTTASSVLAIPSVLINNLALLTFLLVLCQCLNCWQTWMSTVKGLLPTLITKML